MAASVETSDTVAPQVAVLDPVANATVADVIPVVVEASDAFGVAGVELLVDGQVVASEKNPAILAAAILNLGRYQAPETREIVSKYLASTSYRNELAEAAIVL